MKTFILLSCLVLVSCSKDDPGPKYTDITGSWSLVLDANNGADFTISKNGGGLVLDAGSFKVNGKTYTHQGGTIDGNRLVFVYFSSTEEALIQLNDFTASGDFKSISITSYVSRYIGTTDYNKTETKTILITRK